MRHKGPGKRRCWIRMLQRNWTFSRVCENLELRRNLRWQGLWIYMLGRHHIPKQWSSPSMWAECLPSVWWRRSWAYIFYIWRQNSKEKWPAVWNCSALLLNFAHPFPHSLPLSERQKLWRISTTLLYYKWIINMRVAYWLLILCFSGAITSVSSRLNGGNFI